MAYVSHCAQSSDLKASDVFVILLSQDAFESDFPAIKFQAITS